MCTQASFLGSLHTEVHLYLCSYAILTCVINFCLASFPGYFGLKVSLSLENDKIILIRLHKPFSEGCIC